MYVCIKMYRFSRHFPQFFLGNFSRQEGKKFYMQHCIFSRGCLLVKMASKPVITVMIRFSALLPIPSSPPSKKPTLNSHVFFLLKNAPILILRTYQPSFILNSSQTNGNAKNSGPCPDGLMSM